MKPMNITAFMRLRANGKGKPKRFIIKAYSGGLLPVDGFEHPVVVDLAGLETPGAIPILIDHEKTVEATLGATDNIANDGKQLMLEGVVTGVSAKAQQVLAQSAAGHTWQASIGAMVLESESIAAGQTATVNGQTFAGPVIIARRAILRETSVLPMGADSTTSVNLAASARRFLKGSAAMSFEDYVKSLGLDPAALTPEAAAALQTSFAAMTPAAPTANAAPAAPSPAPSVAAPTAAAGAVLDLTASLAEARRTHAAEVRRIADIQAKASGFPMIAAKAIEDNWSVDKVELEVLKASAARTRPTSFRGAEPSAELQPLVIEAAFCHVRGIKNLEKQYEDKVLQAAHSQFRRGIGLQQMFLMAAAANGMHVPPGMRVTTGNIREVLAYSCAPQMVNAAFSTVTLPGILGNTANKEIVEGYQEVDNVWEQIAQIKSVSDFKTVTSYRMLDDMTYEKLGPGGKIKHGKTGEESFTRSADTYAKMYSITRNDIINDDLSAFDDIRERLGRGSAMALSDLFWSTFLGNLGTIFTSTRTNYISGSTTNLGTDGVGLGLGQKAWRQRTSPAGDGSKRLGGSMAKFLLVPPELETIADALYVGRNNSSVKVSDVNTFAGKYNPLCAPQLSDSSISGYSATAWYLFGDKSMGSPMVVSFLNGQQTPIVESADADFSTLGVEFRGYHDFGVDLGDGYMNAVMSKGAL